MYSIAILRFLLNKYLSNRICKAFNLCTNFSFKFSSSFYGLLQTSSRPNKDIPP